MRIRTLFLGALAALLFPACGGGGSDAPIEPALASEAQTMVVQMDVDEDGRLDWVTLDTSAHPFVITETLHGALTGDPVDGTDRMAGTAIDPALSEALADHLARSFDVGERTELEVTLSDERRIGVTVLD
ncbi:MAG: hypothetical protein ACYTGN_12655 [Planctomycetota bacterium]|jgi:hypothetical protein